MVGITINKLFEKYYYPVSLIIRISSLENPHLGVFRSPFIKIIKFDLFIKLFNRSLRFSFVVAAGAVSPASAVHFFVRAAISTPSIRSIAVLLRKYKTVGTASI